MDSFGATLFGMKGSDLGYVRIAAQNCLGIMNLSQIRIRSMPLVHAESQNPELIRSPGSLEEGEFLKRRVKCGECMKVCTTNGLQPVLLEAGCEGIWSPVLVPRIGYCEYRCTLCGQVCPTGAIKRLDQKEKAGISAGTAMFDKGRCLPYAHAMPCIVCEEVCTTPKKAIWFEEVAVR